MSILEQVGHVLLKDLRQTRWMLVAYAAMVLVATANAVSWALPLEGALGMASPLVLLLGMLLVTSVVQADSPSQPDAFWVSLPLSPSAVFGGKLTLAAVIVVGIPAIGQVVGLVGNGVQLVHLPALLWRSVWSYGSFLLFAIVLAALTRDLRTFVLAVLGVLIATPILGVIVATTLASHVTMADPVDDAARLGAQLLSIGGGIGLLAMLYYRRDLKRVVALAAMACMAIAAWASPRDATVGAPYASPQPAMSLTHVASDGTYLDLRLTVEALASGSRARLVNPVVVVHLQDGTTLRVPVAQEFLYPSPVSLTVFDEEGAISSPPKTAATTRWLDPLEGANSADRPLVVPLDVAQVAALTRGIESIDLESWVTVEAASLLGTLPLEAGATATRGPVRVSIQSAVPHSASVTTEISAIRSDQEAPLERAFDLALWNPARHQATTLGLTESSPSSRWLVLPGVTLETRREHLAAADPSKLRRNGWMDGARLAIIEWTPVGSYRLDLRATAAPQVGTEQ